MKSIDQSEVLDEVVLQDEKSVVVAAIKQSVLRLGIHVSPTDGFGRIVIYENTEDGFKELDSLFYDCWTKGARLQPFWWKIASRGHCMETREEAKEHLHLLGFDPKLVDKVFPPMENEIKLANFHA